jgi:hypothetical protein
MGWTLRGSIPGWGKGFLSSSERPDRLCGPPPPPASCSMSTGTVFPEIKRLGRKVHHSSPLSAKVKKKWRYNSTPPLRLRGVHWDKFTTLSSKNDLHSRCLTNKKQFHKQSSRPEGYEVQCENKR